MRAGRPTESPAASRSFASRISPPATAIARPPATPSVRPSCRARGTSTVRPRPRFLPASASPSSAIRTRRAATRIRSNAAFRTARRILEVRPGSRGCRDQRERFVHRTGADGRATCRRTSRSFRSRSSRRRGPRRPPSRPCGPRRPSQSSCPGVDQMVDVALHIERGAAEGPTRAREEFARWFEGGSIILKPQPGDFYIAESKFLPLVALGLGTRTAEAFGGSGHRAPAHSCAGRIRGCWR